MDDCVADPYAYSGTNAVVFCKNTRTAMVPRPIRHSSMTKQEKHKSDERRKEKETGQMKNIYHNGKARSRQRVHVTSGSEEQRHWGDHPETKETWGGGGGGGGGDFTSLSPRPLLLVQLKKDQQTTFDHSETKLSNGERQSTQYRRHTA